jgi:acetyl-CoA carboxylase biotin carboxylase subunit
MGDSAIAMARAVGYVNAGTCEFLLDREGRFYFLEMNTRLQVEHPVTEMVTGVDIVQWQLRIAGGERLPFPDDLTPRGWSVECRITSEDPANAFLPSTGRIDYVHVPAGPGVRWDGGIEAGAEVGLWYDPLLAKLIAWGSTRDQALSRMHRALRELTIVGVETSREFHIRVLENAEFQRGDIDVQWLERSLAHLVQAPPPQDVVYAAAVAAALLADRDRGTPVARSSSRPQANGTVVDATPWREAARRDALR